MVVVVGRRVIPLSRTFVDPLGSSGVMGRRRKQLPEQPVTCADEGTAANDENSKFGAGIHLARNRSSSRSSNAVREPSRLLPDVDSNHGHGD